MTQTPKVEKQIIEDLKKLDGVAAYNRQEPSPGDLERVGNAYAIALIRIHALETALKLAAIVIDSDYRDHENARAVFKNYQDALAKVDV